MARKRYRSIPVEVDVKFDDLLVVEVTKTDPPESLVWSHPKGPEDERQAIHHRAEYPAVGEKVTGKIVGFRDHNHQIELRYIRNDE